MSGNPRVTSLSRDYILGQFSVKSLGVVPFLCNNSNSCMKCKLADEMRCVKYFSIAKAREI